MKFEAEGLLKIIKEKKKAHSQECEDPEFKDAGGRRQAMRGNVWNSRDSYQRWRQDPDMNHLLWWTAGVDHHLTHQTCICNQRLEQGELIKPDLRGQEAAVWVKAGLFLNSSVEHYIMSDGFTVHLFKCVLTWLFYLSVMRRQLEGMTMRSRWPAEGQTEHKSEEPWWFTSVFFLFFNMWCLVV